MKVSKLVSAFTVFACLLGFAAAAWSDDLLASGKGAQGIVGDEAVVSKIESDKVTLRSATDVNREITVSMNNAADLKVGDRVKVQGNIVKKLDAIPASGSQPESGSKSAPAETK